MPPLYARERCKHPPQGALRFVPRSARSLDDRGALGGGDDSPGEPPGISPGKNNRHFLLAGRDRNFLGRVSGNDRDRSIGRGSTSGEQKPSRAASPEGEPTPTLDNGHTRDRNARRRPPLPTAAARGTPRRPTRRAIVRPNHEFHSVTSTPKLCTRLRTT